MSMRWIIVYPAGDRTRLAAVECLDYEMNDYDVAYDGWWPHDEEGERDCKEKTRELGDKHGLSVPSERKYLT